MKEWAYAGSTFDLLGATASHVLSGDEARAFFPPVFFLLMAVSYHLWHKTTATPLPFSRGEHRQAEPRTQRGYTRDANYPTPF